eukprot:9997766-Heterocapsa_arctica.AAC.1
MGYSWLHHNKKDPDLQVFPEIANFLENGIMHRSMAEDEEEQEEDNGLDEDKTGMMTDILMKKFVDMVSANIMTEVEKIKEKLGGLE